MQIIKLHEDCQIVDGASRSLIVDFSRGRYNAIPLSLSAILKDYQGEELSKLLKDYFLEEEILKEYFDFLIQEEFIFFCNSIDEYNCFPPLNLYWDFPAIISNAICDLNEANFNYCTEIIEQLENIGCQHISFRFFKKIDIKQIQNLLCRLIESTISSVEIAAIFNSSFTEQDIYTLCINHPRLNRFIIFNYSTLKRNEEIQIINNCTLIKSKNNVSSHLSCGVINQSYYAINIPHFTESQHHNTCLNRKISIDAEGNIKNCPSMAKSYGNIKDTKLIDVVNNPDFQKVWHIKKDEITKCKDCEFRHICTDCRAYIENPEDEYSAPLKCGYNPYTCEWEEWSTNPLKQKAIEYYGIQELVKSLK